MKTKTIIQLEAGLHLTFDGDVYPEDMVGGLFLEKEIEEVVDSMLVKTYTLKRKKPTTTFEEDLELANNLKIDPLDLSIAHQLDDFIYNLDDEDERKEVLSANFEQICDFILQVYLKNESEYVTIYKIIEAFHSLLEINGIGEILETSRRDFLNYISYITF